MGRSFESVRQGVNTIAGRWGRSSRALKKEDQQYGSRLVELAKMHSSEAFIGCDDSARSCGLLSPRRDDETPGKDRIAPEGRRGSLTGPRKGRLIPEQRESFSLSREDVIRKIPFVDQFFFFQ